jgi:hypothetical protein
VGLEGADLIERLHVNIDVLSNDLVQLVCDKGLILLALEDSLDLLA